MRFDSGPIPAPTDTNSRTEYPRPWMGGRWTLGDIVDYEMIATLALLETAADRRETIMRQIYEVNRQTIEAGRKGSPSSILVPAERQQEEHLRSCLHQPGQFVVHVLERVAEAVDARAQQRLRIVDPGRMHHHAHAVPVRLVDNRPIQAGGELADCAPAVVDPRAFAVALGATLGVGIRARQAVAA